MAKIPGTFKDPRVETLRLVEVSAPEATGPVLAAGAVYVKAYRFGECDVMVSRNPTPASRSSLLYTEVGFRWHLSISHPRRYPTWDEIKAARYLAPELQGVELMAQLLPKLKDESEWVNAHDNVFHLHEMVAS